MVEYSFGLAHKHTLVIGPRTGEELKQQIECRDTEALDMEAATGSRSRDQNGKATPKLIQGPVLGFCLVSRWRWLALFCWPNWGWVLRS